MAGIVLGGIPLVLWALDKYREPVKSYWKYNITLSTLQSDIFVQQKQLELTLGSIGMYKPSIEELRACLKGKYPSQHEQFLAIIGQMDEVTKRLLDKLQIDIEGKPLWTDEPPSRAQWEWRRIKRSFGAKERRSLVDKLQYWNNALKSCFEKPEMPAEEEDLKVREIQARFNSKHCDATRVTMRAIHGALQNSWNCICPCSHHAAIHLDWQSRIPILPTTFDMALSFQDTSAQGAAAHWCWRMLRVEIEKIGLNNIEPVAQPDAPLQSSSFTRSMVSESIEQQRASSRSLLKRPQKKVKFESRPCNEPNHATQLPQPASGKILCLCSQIREKSKSSAALGFLADNEPEGKTYCLSHAPSTKPSILKSLQLKSLIPGRNFNLADRDPPHLTLSAKQRYGIAAAITWAILHFSGTPWLCDAWDREQTSVFLEDDGSGQKAISQTGCISYLFESHAALRTLGHSDTFKSEQIRNKTLFALGVILIELCLNKRFDEFTVDSGTGSPANIQLDDFQTANNRVDEVYSQGGDSYGYAVQRCLRCEFPGPDTSKDFEYPTFRRHFYNGVVAPVQATYFRYPASYATI